ncbi:MAG: hypothetical protein HC902_02920 [Calothrix sp. SM1_5_4]|nr:hypothetical protein [Calothrix sp. SM1_5_4]
MLAVLARDYGTIHALRGLTESGQVLNEWRIDTSTPWARAASREGIFPLAAEDNSWFDRNPLPSI